MMRYWICLALALIATGCSTVTKEKINTLPSSDANVSPSLSQAVYKGLKRKVAIARFSNETSAGASFLLDSDNDRIGKQASDILSARLVETNRFILLERLDLGKLIDEANLNNVELKQVGADYLIIGSVSEYGREAVSETGVFSRNKKQKARAKVNVRLVDALTGQVIYSEEGSGEAISEANRVFGVGASAGYDTSLDDKAISAAISKLVSNIVENLMSKPWQAYIIGKQDSTYIFTGGESQGVKVGDSFDVMQKGDIVRNPQTGFDIELPRKKIASLEVVAQAGESENEISFGQLVSGDLTGADLSSLVIQEPKNRERN